MQFAKPTEPRIVWALNDNDQRLGKEGKHRGEGSETECCRIDTIECWRLQEIGNHGSMEKPACTGPLRRLGLG
ncbi:phosphohydrolase [Anopheles sinensis]|uniref:Phosphohydrolase n=1 Tax=Anopheles sinensis TaxID=74873 RepID=A0A084WN86_ANOSI|nr:phosphohydrolase [Anopheles sinensis]